MLLCLLEKQQAPSPHSALTAVYCAQSDARTLQVPLRLLSELRCLLDDREAGAPAAGASEAPSAPASAPSNTARRRKSGAAASGSGRQPEGPALALLPGHTSESESGACLGGSTEAQGSNLGSCLTASIPGMTCCLPAVCRSHSFVLHGEIRRQSRAHALCACYGCHGACLLSLSG
jgi:hypothetical protein